MALREFVESFRLREIALASVLLVGGAWPDEDVRSGFSRFYANTAYALLFRDLELGKGGGMEVLPAPDKERGKVSQDAILQMRIEGMSSRAKLGINLRRDVYLPVLIAFCSALAMPLGLAGKVVTALASSLITLALATLALVGLAVWYLATQASAYGVYEAGGSMTQVSEFLFRYVFTPPSHRFIVPMAVSFLCFVAVRAVQRTRHRARS